MSTDHVDLIRQAFASSTVITEQEIKYSVNIAAQYDITLRGLLIRLNAHVWAEHLGEVQTPATWWDHWKMSKAPTWFVKRWPVKYVVHDAQRMYPNISIPDQRSVARFFIRREPEGFGIK